MLEVLNTGSKVIIGEDIEATILRISISDESVQYECAWYDGSSRTVAWLHPCEITAKKVTKLKIGFKDVPD